MSLPAWSNVSLSGRVAAAVIGTLYLLQSVAPTVRSVFALVPARVVPCVWQLLTAGALETALIKAALNICGLVLAAQVLEPVWGVRELASYTALASVAATGATLVAAYVAYVLNVYAKDAGKIIFSPYCGAHGILAAALVALKQVTPDSEVTLLGTIKFRVGQLPGAYAAAALVVGLVTRSLLGTVPAVLGGAYVGWLYLRYGQARPGLELRGDPSTDFALATFFPAPLVPTVERVSDVVSRITGLAAQAPTVLSAEVLGAPVLSDEAARRRERGARALEERLTAKAGVMTKVKDGDVEAGAGQA